MVDAYCDDIRVAKALRLLTGPVMDNGVVVAALSHSCVACIWGVCVRFCMPPDHRERVSPKLLIPLQRTQDYEVSYEDGTQATETYVVGGVVHCPPFSWDEFLAVVVHYWKTVGPLLDAEYIDEDEAEPMLQRAYQLTQGDMRVFRKSVRIEMGTHALDALKEDKRRR